MIRTWMEKLRIPKFQWVSDSGEDPKNLSPIVTVYMIMVPMIILMIIGLLMAFSSQAVLHISNDDSPFLAFGKPVFLLTAALIAGLIVSNFSPEFYKRWAFALWGASLLLQVLVLTPLGASEGGNTNWIHIPGIPFLIQPSELLKLTTILVLAAAFDRPGTRLSDPKQVAFLAGAPVGLAALDVMAGRDLGTAMVLIAACFGAVFITGIPARWIWRSVAGMLVVVVLLVFQNPTRITRIVAVLPGFKPDRNLSAPEQIDHSLWAFGAGGVFGVGPGASREKWKYLQAAHTDFILAIIGEEFGLLGSFVVVACLMALVIGMIRLAQSVNTLFEAMVSAGVATWIGFQSFVNVATVTGLGPVIGVPLPFVSSGGSSLIFTTAAVGVVMSIARRHAGLTWSGRRALRTFGRDPRFVPRRRSRGA